jgi:hypothetical protein
MPARRPVAPEPAEHRKVLEDEPAKGAIPSVPIVGEVKVPAMTRNESAVEEAGRMTSLLDSEMMSEAFAKEEVLEVPWPVMRMYCWEPYCREGEEKVLLDCCEVWVEE